MVAIASQKMTLAIAALILAFTGPSLGAPLSVPEFKATQTFDDGMYHWTPSSAAATSIAIQSPISLPTSIAVPTSLPGAGTTKATTTGPILTSQATSIAIPSVTTAPVESVTPEAPETSEAPSATTSVEEEETTTTGTESAPTGVTETEGGTGSEYNPGSIVNKVSSAIKPITKASSAHPTSAHPTTARPTSAHPTSVKPKPSSTGTKSSVAPKPTSTGGGAASGTKVPYTGDGSTWPTMDKWASFDAMWTKFSPLFASSCTSKNLPTNSAAETANIKTAIRTISKKHSVDERVILAMVMQESGGCARVKTTTSPPPDNIPNPGLMQDYKGSHNCEGFGTKECPKSQIDGMIEDGTSFFAEKVKGAGALSPAPKNPAQKYYWALRIYNSGNYKPGDNLVGSAGAATAPYASDMANRLMGVAW